MFRYLLFRLIHRLVVVLPQRASYWIACRIADIGYLFRMDIREAVKSNLEHILSFGGGASFYGTVPAPKIVFRNFSKYLVDFFSFSKLNSDNFRRIVSVRGEEHIQSALSKGRGVIGVTAHLGNWELAGVVTALLGVSVNAVALSHENTKINRLFVNQRVSKGIKVIPVGAPAGEYINVLKKNEFIALLGDRITAGRGMKMNFFGTPVVMPKGPAVLSKRTGAPIVPGFIVRMPGDKFEMIFEPPIYPGEFHGPYNSSVKAIMHRIISVLERYIAGYPSQWFLFYKVWGR